MRSMERQAGYDAGKLHGTPIPGVSMAAAKSMYNENVQKVERVRNNPHADVRVKEYWQGYGEGMKDNQ